MTPKWQKCQSDQIPRECAREFQELRSGQMEIKTMLEAHIRAEKTLIRRAWDIAKGVTLLVVGWFLGTR